MPVKLNAGANVTVPSAFTVHAPSVVVTDCSTAAVPGSRSTVAGLRVAPRLALSLPAGAKLTGVLNGVLALSLSTVGAAVGLTVTAIAAVAAKPPPSATV